MTPRNDPNDAPTWLLKYILDELLALRDRVRALEMTGSPISSSGDHPAKTRSLLGDLRDSVALLADLARLILRIARMIPWGLVAFGGMTVWQVVVPFARRLLHGFGIG